jgi:predicted nucleotidyltransferase
MEGAQTEGPAGTAPSADEVWARRDEIVRIAERHGARNVRLFGSAARGDAGPGSDVDLLVDVGAAPSPWFPAGLIADLEDLLGRRVDVVTALDRVHPLVREQIAREAVPL